MSDGPEILGNLLAKARRSLGVAEGLLEDGHADFAASRAYYKGSIEELRTSI